MKSQGVCDFCVISLHRRSYSSLTSTTDGRVLSSGQSHMADLLWLVVTVLQVAYMRDRSFDRR